MMDAKGVRNTKSILVIVNKHNTARVASCWFIIYYGLVMHGNSNIKYKIFVTVNSEIIVIIAKFLNFFETQQQSSSYNECGEYLQRGRYPA